MQGFNENLFRWVNQLSIDHGYLNPLFIGLAEYTVLLATAHVSVHMVSKSEQNQ